MDKKLSDSSSSKGNIKVNRWMRRHGKKRSSISQNEAFRRFVLRAVRK